MGQYTVQEFLQYYLRDLIDTGTTSSTTAVALLLMPMLLAAAITAYIGANDPLVTSPRAKTPGSMHGSIGSAGSTGYALQSREHTPGSAGSLGYGLIDERKRNDGFSRRCRCTQR